MQIALSRIWTWLVESISKDNNCYTMPLSTAYMFYTLPVNINGYIPLFMNTVNTIVSRGIFAD